MASFNKFYQFVEDLGDGVHKFKTADDTLKVYASNTTPDQALDLVKADLAEITVENNYPAGGSDVVNDASETTGTLTVVGTDVVWTASGGSFGPLRYVVLYNDTPTSPADPLIGWWDYGTSVTVNDTETFTVDFGSSLFTIT